MRTLRNQLIRLAYQKPSLRGVLLPLLSKSAGLAWVKGTVSVKLTDGTAEEAQGVTLGVWAVHKALRGSGWDVTFLPSGDRASHYSSLKMGKGFVEAMIAEEPSLASARTVNDLKPHFRMMNRLQRNPREWQTPDLSSLTAPSGVVPAPAPAKRVPKPKLRSFGEARMEIFKALQDAGWTMSSLSLKVPHATSPNGYLRLWFKKQAIAASEDRGGRHSFGDARAISYDLDIRKLTGKEFLNLLKRWYPEANL